MNTFYVLGVSNPELTVESLKGFIDTHYVELVTNPNVDIVELYKEWAYVNNYLKFFPM
jgi:hypothetical protein